MKRREKSEEINLYTIDNSVERYICDE